MPMTSWNLNLVNVKKTALNHVWGLSSMIYAHVSQDCHTPPSETLDDLVRIPADSKSSFDLEEQNGAYQQKQHCNTFLFSAGVNRGLVGAYSGIRAAQPTDPYAPPAKQAHVIAHAPERLAKDLDACSSTCTGDTFTVEDKGPSVLWSMRNEKIFDYWYHLMANCPLRWGFPSLPTEEVLKNNRTIMNSILPKTLIGNKHAFSTNHLPYAYFTMKS